MTNGTQPHKLFLTVGAQLPFDRLVRAVDDWAGTRKDVDIFAQVGEGGYVPRNLASTPLCSPSQFRAHVLWADLVVAHAGMGSILQALQFGKPILVMPRIGRLRETRNDHQLATAERLRAMGRVSVAMDERELRDQLDSARRITAGATITDRASDQLLAALREFIHGSCAPRHRSNH